MKRQSIHDPEKSDSLLDNKSTSFRTRSEFEEHWQTNVLPEIGVSKLTEARSFLQIAFKQIEKSKRPVRILDVGCGDGVHTAVLAQAEVGPFTYSGMDVSLEAARLASKRPKMHSEHMFNFQTGDALLLPYCSNTFDVVFSYGVIAYTGSPEDAIDEMVRVCRPGGLLGIWLYPKMEGIVGSLFEFTRFLCRRLGRRWSKIIIYPIVLMLPVLPVRSGINLSNSTWQQCIEVVEINLLPEELGFYTLKDVLGWFSKRNLDVRFIDKERPIAVWAQV
ncbi:MAG: class I SAM-dependent methyltransferase [Chloroflexi bacterium]|nr:class I SAM-dependent methyltransferase [Chloroflexota bacterium]